ncbi:hypothetical protein K504DRAFT_160872 [Pleomassaria siparia CBS 279.74]|uniref:Uncharacterized protein n=1 Tax=Pleomassaria siparia CBS 279.74 TaxID=1314801 RepID=A0A6G1JUD9_9PLEO|nr:hypothetical protein K504DRAFT_160872 [Pleomassaria siparia CBS 279.74]
MLRKSTYNRRWKSCAHIPSSLAIVNYRCTMNVSDSADEFDSRVTWSRQIPVLGVATLDMVKQHRAHSITYHILFFFCTPVGTAFDRSGAIEIACIAAIPCSILPAYVCASSTRFSNRRLWLHLHPKLSSPPPQAQLTADTPGTSTSIATSPFHFSLCANTHTHTHTHTHLHSTLACLPPPLQLQQQQHLPPTDRTRDFNTCRTAAGYS